VHPFCNLQSRARTHGALVIGLYELLGKNISENGVKHQKSNQNQII
jgi:hypothetical protein